MLITAVKDLEDCEEISKLAQIILIWLAVDQWAAFASISSPYNTSYPRVFICSSNQGCKTIHPLFKK